MTTASRRVDFQRITSETQIEGSLDLDGTGVADVATGLGFFDHMLDALVRHSRIDLTLRAKGDTQVDDHHTVEDVAIVIGQAVAQALGDRRGIERFATGFAPLDEALVRSVLDLSGRPWPEIHLDFPRPTVGDVATENVIHFFRSFAIEARAALHIDQIRGDNTHHIAEAAFKATAIALRDAVRVTTQTIPSTKGTLA